MARRHEATGGLPTTAPGGSGRACSGPACTAATSAPLRRAADGRARTGIDDSLQRLNGVKNILAAAVNAIAGLIFAVVADVDWWVVLIIGIGSVIGGQLGATVGRRLPPLGLRIAIVTVGTVALLVFLFS